MTECVHPDFPEDERFAFMKVVILMVSKTVAFLFSQESNIQGPSLTKEVVLADLLQPEQKFINALLIIHTGSITPVADDEIMHIFAS